MKWIPSIVFAMVITDCSVQTQLGLIRPTASSGVDYIVHSGDLDGIEWIDKSTQKPTQPEMDQALADCQAQIGATHGISLEDRLSALESKNSDLIKAVKTISDGTGIVVVLPPDAVPIDPLTP